VASQRVIVSFFKAPSLIISCSINTKFSQGFYILCFNSHKVVLRSGVALKASGSLKAYDFYLFGNGFFFESSQKSFTFVENNFQNIPSIFTLKQTIKTALLTKSQPQVFVPKRTSLDIR
jgi:hypothetical protein